MQNTHTHTNTHHTYTYGPIKIKKFISLPCSRPHLPTSTCSLFVPLSWYMASPSPQSFPMQNLSFSHSRFKKPKTNEQLCHTDFSLWPPPPFHPPGCYSVHSVPYLGFYNSLPVFLCSPSLSGQCQCDLRCRSTSVTTWLKICIMPSPGLRGKCEDLITIYKFPTWIFLTLLPLLSFPSSHTKFWAQLTTQSSLNRQCPSRLHTWAHPVSSSTF